MPPPTGQIYPLLFTVYMFARLGLSQRYHCTAVTEISGNGKIHVDPKKKVSVSQKCPGRKVKFLCIPISFSSTLNTQYLKLCNFSSKWIQLKNLSILMQFLHFDLSIYFNGSIYLDQSFSFTCSKLHSRYFFFYFVFFLK